MDFVSTPNRRTLETPEPSDSWFHSQIPGSMPSLALDCYGINIPGVIWEEEEGKASSRVSMMMMMMMQL